MRVHQEADGIVAHAVSGTYVVHMGFDVADPTDFLGFAIHFEMLIGTGSQHHFIMRPTRI